MVRSDEAQLPEDHDDALAEHHLFREPEGYYEPPKPPTDASHHLRSGQTLTLRLVGHNPLWGHLLWNAGRVVSDYLEDHAGDLIRGRTILELGAGAGLPGLVCAMHASDQVVVTDYPDADLVDNLRHNISQTAHLRSSSSICAEGYLWGSPTDELLSHLPDPAAGFEVLILADVLFNHSEHEKLVWTITRTLTRSETSKALVFFTPYRPWMLDRDLAFFDVARAKGLVVKKVLEHVMDKVMFSEDPGDEMLRRTVFGYELQWEQNSPSKDQ
ncbi:MAG: nicotinamide n-methyltransferase [Caeruleum heppii]|nr:MAG: nicotinamide n-methyltransferase [Caeruleum heppii]